MEQAKSLSRKIAPTTFIGLLSFTTRFVFSKSWKHRQEREPVRAGVGSLYEERKPQSAKPCLFTIFLPLQKWSVSVMEIISLVATLFGLREEELRDMEL